MAASDGIGASALSADLIAGRHASRGPETAFISTAAVRLGAPRNLSLGGLLLPPLQASFWSQAAVTVCTHSSFTLMNTWRQQRRAVHTPPSQAVFPLGNVHWKSFSRTRRHPHQE